jgi:hypothetical protein
MLPQIKKPEWAILIFYGIYLLCTLATITIDRLNKESDSIALSNANEKKDFIVRSKFVGRWNHQDTLSGSFDEELQSPVIMTLKSKVNVAADSVSENSMVFSLIAFNRNYFEEGYWLFEHVMPPASSFMTDLI